MTKDFAYHGTTASLPPLTRGQRRLLRKLADRADRVWQADLTFFEKHLDRMHRVRPADQDELAYLAILEGGLPEIPSGYRFFVIVRLVALGQRLRLFVPAPENSETDLDERGARWAFKMSATQRVWKIEAEMRKAARLQS